MTTIQIIEEMEKETDRIAELHEEIEDMKAKHKIAEVEVRKIDAAVKALECELDAIEFKQNVRKQKAERKLDKWRTA